MYSQTNNRRIRLAFVNTDVEGLYGRELSRGVAEAAQSLNVDIVMAAGRTIRANSGFGYQFNVIFRHVNEATVDGVVLAAGALANFKGNNAHQLLTEQFGKLPLMAIGHEFDGRSAVVVDNTSCMIDLVEHLVGHHGFCRLAWAGGPASNPEAMQRKQAFLQALAKHGLGLKPEHDLTGDFTTASGHSLGKQIAQQFRGQLDAVVAANDDMAIAIMEELELAGIRVPADLAVTGFDDIRESNVLITSLTTIRQPIRELGRVAVQDCLALIKGQPTAVRMLPTRLVIRESCGCLSPFMNPVARSDGHDLRVRLVEEASQYDGVNPLAFALLVDQLMGDGHGPGLPRVFREPQLRLEFSSNLRDLVQADRADTQDFQFLSDGLDRLRLALL
jgi:DNA-binding LacI/PurR family transcriptional regulator